MAEISKKRERLVLFKTPCLPLESHIKFANGRNKLKTILLMLNKTVAKRQWELRKFNNHLLGPQSLSH